MTGLEIDSSTRIFIIEGVAGSGKSTLQTNLQEKLKNRLVYTYKEEELLFSWKHAWISGIESLRLDFMEKFLDYCEQILLKNKNAVFVLDRFHITFFYLVIQHKGKTVMDEGMKKRYAALIARLKKLPVHIYVPLLRPEEIEERSSHKERKEEAWALHLQKRLSTTGFNSLQEMYIDTQRIIKECLEQQDIPFTLLDAV